MEGNVYTHLNSLKEIQNIYDQGNKTTQSTKASTFMDIEEKIVEKPKQEKNDEKPQMKKLFQKTIISNEIHLKILGISIPINSYPHKNWPINTNLNFSLSFACKITSSKREFLTEFIVSNIFFNNDSN